MTLKDVGAILRDTGQGLWDDDGFGIASEAAFSFAFSLFPLLLLIVTLLGLLGQDPRWSESLTVFLSRFIPAIGVEIVHEYLDRIRPTHAAREISISLLLLFWPASWVFNAYMKATTRAYGAPDQRPFFVNRLIAVGLVIFSGVVFAAVFLAMVLAPLLLRYVDFFGIGSTVIEVFRAVRFPAALILLVPTLAVIYTVGHDAPSSARLPVWPGAMAATLLWMGASQLFSLYVTHVGMFVNLYGALAGAMLLLAWMYLTSLAIITGAEFNVACHRWKTRRQIRPEPAPVQA
jgi:membrane protein